ncbi:hypothetical protein HO133_003552 [Letharia lupina]|uniref:Vegetatible incompatibility protein HET-E-1 n=1 Tax=Letharia lupina TaxID=560253 RepID=A0A8H6F8Z7_9LECA|nr:uncharacterized protein HO133_003552 [Letharia lupina]KAF6219727.1 hypothetical protein HO133_003552 [Letharia lupina]
MTMNDIESQRQENIKRNREQLTQLGIYLTPSASSPPLAKGPPARKRKLDHPLPPSRSSARIASTPAKPFYVSENEAEDWRHSRKKGSRVGPKKAKEPVIKQEAVAIAPIPAKDIESIRAGWITWESNASPPIRDDDSTFHFQDQSSFTPNKSPEELIREGCFGGSYFRPLYSRRLGITVTDDYRQLPSTWYAGLDVSRSLTSPTYDAEINKYKVSSGQSIEEWEAAGWINHTYDVRGWFQWYCRFYMGRRCEDDERQISRWRKCVGETGRWRRMLLKKYVSMGIKEVFDDGEDEEGRDVSPVMHQTCHHWAYEVRQGDLERFWNAGK